MEDELREELSAAGRFEQELHGLQQELANTPLWGHLRKKLGEARPKSRKFSAGSVSLDEDIGYGKSRWFITEVRALPPEMGPHARPGAAWAAGPTPSSWTAARPSRSPSCGPLPVKRVVKVQFCENNVMCILSRPEFCLIVVFARDVVGPFGTLRLQRAGTHEVEHWNTEEF